MSNADHTQKKYQKHKSPSASDKTNPWQPRLSFWEWLAFFAIIGIFVAIFFPFPHDHGSREKQRQRACMSNLKQQSAAFLMYAEDNDAKFPPTEKWTEVILPYVLRKQSSETERFVVFRCPNGQAKQTGSFNYAIHDGLSGMSQHKIVAPENASLLFETSTTQKNAHNNGNSFAMPHSGQEKKFGGVAFADGHVKMQPAL
jgi:prepilin-type processing-associated H-X9-DG protein